MANQNGNTEQCPCPECNTAHCAPTATCETSCSADHAREARRAAEEAALDRAVEAWFGEGYDLDMLAEALS